ncbi:hypothetical protein PILCRDRAFT_90260 [Piloderma croceum F 1598]|uniref:Secreted protein n=1 Tax=Piloderma croceum (strain F 1598) TaxID=765440 RepID=A0A0C3FH51_PILCF|nr:hypothetical protein PILCRDRAFT_90260 [Piloderma croceum F 1598]
MSQRIVCGLILGLFLCLLSPSLAFDLELTGHESNHPCISMDYLHKLFMNRHICNGTQEKSAGTPPILDRELILARWTSCCSLTLSTGHHFVFGFGEERQTRLNTTMFVHPLFSSSPQSISNVAGLRLLALSVILQD